MAYTRALPPLASRQQVSRQCSEIDAWSNLGSDSEVLVSTKSFAALKYDESELGSLSDQASTPAIKSEVNVKRRLVISANATNLADQTLEASTAKPSVPQRPPESAQEVSDGSAIPAHTDPAPGETPVVINHVSPVPPSPSSSTTTLCDDGYWSNTLSPVGTDLTNLSNEEHLVKSLAGVHSHRAKSDTKANNNWIDFAEAGPRKRLQLEQETISRSVQESQQRRNRVLQSKPDDHAASFVTKDVGHHTTSQKFHQSTLRETLASIGGPGSDTGAQAAWGRSKSSNWLDSPGPQHRKSFTSFSRGPNQDDVRPDRSKQQTLDRATRPHKAYSQLAASKANSGESHGFSPSRRRTAPQSSTLHPASRQAAEKWRSQNRASDHNVSRAVLPQRDNFESRLLAIKTGRNRPIYEPEIDETQRELDETTAWADFDSASSPPKPPKIPVVPERRSSPRRSRLLSRLKQAEPKTPAIPLGEGVDVDFSDTAAVKAERVRLREQRKDLEKIQEVYRQMAIINGERDFEDSEWQWFSEVRKIALTVLEERRSAKLLRPELSRLSDNFKRAIRRLRMSKELDVDLFTIDDVRPELEQLLGQEHVITLEDALEKLVDTQRELEANAEAQRLQDIQARKALRAEKSVRFASVDDAQDADGNVRSQPSKKRKRDAGGESKGANRTGYRTIRLSREQLLKNRLGQYVSARLEREQCEVGKTLEEGHNDNDSTSEISEEDADGETYFGGSISTQQPARLLTEMPPAPSRGEDETPTAAARRQEREKTSELDAAHAREDQPHVSGQVYDQRLVLENQLARLHQQREVEEENEAAAEEVRFDDLASLNSGSDGEGEHSDDDDYHDDDAPPQAFLYKVTGTFRGVDRYSDVDEYEFGSFSRKDKAEEQVARIITSLNANYGPQNGDYCTLSATYGPDVHEQSLSVGPGDGVVQARVFIEKSIIDLNQREAKRARKARPTSAGHVWAIEWEKTIITTTTTTTTTTSLIEPSPDLNVEPITADDDDLFGEASPLPTIKSTPTTANSTSTSTSTEIVQPSYSEVESYSCPRLANNAAKDFLVDWLAQFAPPHERSSMAWPGHKGILGHYEKAKQEEVDDMVEGELVGPWEEARLWPEVVHVDDDGGRRVVQVEEKLWLKVVKTNVRGPKN